VLPLRLEAQKPMPVRTRRPELLLPVRYRACLLYNTSRVYHPGDVHRVPRLHVCDGRPSVLLIPLLVLVSLLGLERGRLPQKLLTNANSDFLVR
jgi:hypothetical protein